MVTGRTLALGGSPVVGSQVEIARLVPPGLSTLGWMPGSTRAPVKGDQGPSYSSAVDSHVFRRTTRPLALAMAGYVAVTTFLSKPAPGAHGQHLAVAVALVGVVGGTVALFRVARLRASLQLPLLVAIVLSAAALVGLQPNGPGFFGVFPAVTVAALMLPEDRSPIVAGVALVSLAVSWLLEGSRPLSGVVLNELGVVAFYLVAMFARSNREASVRAEELIASLEEARAAQAEAAALAERSRLAREMHDVLAHSLSGLLLTLESARLLTERGAPAAEVAESIERAHRLARSGLTEARRAIGMLRDDALPGPERLAVLASDFAGDCGVPCDVSVAGDVRDLGADGRLTLYRVAQEALTNVRKHARPERVEMRLRYDPGGIRLTIEDFESPGERPPPGDGTGYGLTGMRERAALIGATVTAGPTAEGFRVELWMPR